MTATQQTPGKAGAGTCCPKRDAPGAEAGAMVERECNAPAVYPRRRGKSQSSLDLIKAARAIAEVAQPITVRGIAYKLFTRGMIPDMGKASTQKVSVQLTWARENGLIPWEWIVDETRNAERAKTWRDPDAIINAAVKGYRRNYWQDQPNWVEVWSEKGTVRGVLAPVLDQFGVTFRVHHGFSSATAINDIAEETRAADRPLIVLYTGDWDPSGLCMSEIDLPERLERYGGDVEFRRVALRADDVHRYTSLPSFPLETKRGDSRHDWFRENYGTRCWELDAMDPNALRKRVLNAILNLIDGDAWQHALQVEAAEVESMLQFHAAWNRSKSGLGPICSGGGQ